MRQSFLSFFLVALFFVPTALAGTTSPATATEPFPVGKSEKVTVLITEEGFDPPRITLTQLDGSVFFLNGTKDSLLSISVGFGSKRAHCASENLRVDSKGDLSSVQPIGPHDFAILCFPEQGTYPVSVSGVGASGRSFRGEVVVSEKGP